MPSYLSTIGFNTVYTMVQFTELARYAAAHGKIVDPERPDYLCWSPGSGAELWTRKTRRSEVVVCNPHFSGASRLRAGITTAPIKHMDGAFDGSLYCGIDPTEENPGDGFPIVIDVPDFDRVRSRISVPSVVTVQIAAFAHELKCYASDEEFANSQTTTMKFASESYLPSGIFTPQLETREPPEAKAIFTGHILEADLCTNPFTGLQFHYLSLKTLPGIIDVVADPEIVQGQPTVGGVAHGDFWLTGRVISELSPAKDKGPLKRLFSH